MSYAVERVPAPAPGDLIRSRRLTSKYVAAWRAFWGRPDGPICYICHDPATRLSVFVGFDASGGALELTRFRCATHRATPGVISNPKGART